MKSPFLPLVSILALIAAPSWAASPPPGVVIDETPEPATAYVGSPSIAILPDGSYVASHDFFGKKGRWLRTTSIFGSGDRGATWHLLAHLSDQTWSTLFFHDDALYLLGAAKEYGDIIIRKSTDGGQTWSTPTDASHGLLFPGTFHCGPTPVVVHGGRIWRAFERYSGTDGSWSGRFFHSLVISVPEKADLLQAANWTRTNDIAFDGNWVPGFRTGWLEGNVVVAPDGNVVNLLRVNAPPTLQDRFELEGPAAGIPRFELAARIEIAADGSSASFDPARGFFRFPGSQSKFTIRFDPTSHLYWSLVNKITNPYSGYPPTISPELQRNVLVLTSSPDLRHWDEHYIALRWHEGLPFSTKDRVAFQYVDWQFDGDDLVAVSRTSWNGQSYHNANFLTFHRVPHFRTLTRADSPPALAGPDGPDSPPVGN